MGVALGACTVPAAGKPGFSLDDGEMELGLGIHGEQGVRRVPLQPADAVVDTIVSTLVTQMGLREERVALLVNGLGGTPPMELAIVARRALAALRGRGIQVERAWAGNFMTALEMPGCSLSLMVVDDARLGRLDLPTDAPAWPGGGRVGPRRVFPAAPGPAVSAPSGEVSGAFGDAVRRAALAVASALEREEAALTELDSRAGDGDLGISMSRGAAAIRTMPDDAWGQPAAALTSMAQVLAAGDRGEFGAVLCYGAVAGGSGAWVGAGGGGSVGAGFCQCRGQCGGVGWGEAWRSVDAGCSGAGE